MNDEQKPSQPDEEIPPEVQPEQESEVTELGVQEQDVVLAETKKMPRWLRQGLIGLGVVVVLFFAGFLTDHFARFIPLKASFNSVSQQALELEKQVSTLTTNLASANKQISGLKSDNAILQSELDAAVMHGQLLAIVRDLQAAQIALSNDDVSGAKVALVMTPERLIALKPAVAMVDATLADNISDRLEEAITTMDTRTGVAEDALAKLANNLLNVEELLYK